MWQKQTHRSSVRESIKALEADIQHANTLAAALPRDLGEGCIQMKVYVDGMPKMYSQERKATLREFYTVIYPSLKQLKDDMLELNKDEYKKTPCFDIFSRKGVEERKTIYKDPERDNECGICMEIGSKVVLPNCGHSMCISCYHDWYVRSQSCPFCRGSLKRVSSRDLWILTSNCDVIDTITLARENLRRFYLYIEKLPVIVSDNNILLYDYMI